MILKIIRALMHSILLKAIMILRIAKVRLGKGSRIYSNVFIKYPKNILIGNNTFINYGCIIWAAPNSKIIIGDDVILGPRVSLIASNHGIKKDNIIRLNEWLDDDIIIGNDVWLGANSIILAGVKIGNGSVVAANAVVNNDVEPFTVVGGVPAKVISSRG